MEIENIEEIKNLTIEHPKFSETTIKDKFDNFFSKSRQLTIEKYLEFLIPIDIGLQKFQKRTAPGNGYQRDYVFVSSPWITIPYNFTLHCTNGGKIEKTFDLFSVFTSAVNKFWIQRFVFFNLFKSKAFFGLRKYT